MWLFLPVLAVVCFVLALAASLASLPEMAITMLAVAIGLRCLQLLAERRMSLVQFTALMAVLCLPPLVLADGPCPGGQCSKNGTCAKPLPSIVVPAPATVEYTAAKPKASAKPQGSACECKPRHRLLHRHGPLYRLLHRRR